MQFVLNDVHPYQKRFTVFTDFWEETKRDCIIKMQETSFSWQQNYVRDVFLKTPQEESNLCPFGHLFSFSPITELMNAIRDRQYN